MAYAAAQGAKARKDDAVMGTRRSGPAGALAALPVAAALACAALAGCGNAVAVNQARTAGHRVAQAPATTTVCPYAGQVDRLTISRVNTLPQNHEQFTFPAQITITSAQRAQAAARALCALPPMPHSSLPMNCPADFGVSYLLSFASGARRFQVVTADPAGCEEINGLGPAARWAISAAFWQRLGTAASITHPGNSAFRGTMPP